MRPGIERSSRDFGCGCDEGTTGHDAVASKEILANRSPGKPEIPDSCDFGDRCRPLARNNTTYLCRCQHRSKVHPGYHTNRNERVRYMRIDKLLQEEHLLSRVLTSGRVRCALWVST